MTMPEVTLSDPLSPEQIDELRSAANGLTSQIAIDLIEATMLASRKLEVKASTVANEFRWQAPLLGLREDALGVIFVMRGKAYRVTGLATNRPKYPINAEQVDTGKGFKFPRSTVEVINAAAERRVTA